MTWCQWWGPRTEGRGRVHGDRALSRGQNDPGNQMWSSGPSPALPLISTPHLRHAASSHDIWDSWCLHLFPGWLSEMAINCHVGCKFSWTLAAIRKLTERRRPMVSTAPPRGPCGPIRSSDLVPCSAPWAVQFHKCSGFGFAFLFHCKWNFDCTEFVNLYQVYE